jgi:hypothetical protein
LESCHIPNITNMTGNSVLLRLNASSEYKTFDTSKKLNGNPIILSTIVHPSAQSNNLFIMLQTYFIVLIYHLIFYQLVLLNWN